MEEVSGKRILYVITKSNWGGAQAYVYALAAHATEAGAEVVVVFGGTGRPEGGAGLLAERLAEADIRTITLPSLAREVSLGSEWRAFRELRECFKREQPDLVHLNSSKAGALGALAARLSHVPRIVFTAHGWPHREPRSWPVRVLIWLASWVTVLLCHAVIAVSECDCRGAPALLARRKVRLVHNGVAPFTLVSREEARRFLAPDIRVLEKARWILVPAELTRNKGVDFAIRAFAGVSTNIDDAALVVVGDGEEHGRLMKLIQEYGLERRVFLLGFVPEARRYFHAADIFLLSSRKEGLPIALLEAGVAGLPAIASRTGGIPEVIEHEKSGLLVRPGNIDGLADALTRLLTKPEEARAYGARLKKVVQERFSEERMLAETVDVYSE